MVVLGLTGGVACGKSTVARWLVDRGAVLIDADQIAREMVQPGTPGLADVVQHFGGTMLRPDGTLDRIRLGALVFSDSKALADLNALLHPRIVAAMRRELEGAEAEGVPLVVVDAALLLELGLDTWCSAVIDVEATPELQIERLMARNSLDRKAAEERVAAQWHADQRRARATWTLDNVGTLEELGRKLAAVWHEVSRSHPQLLETTTIVP